MSYRQSGDYWTLAVSGDGGDARGDALTYGLELAQLLRNGIYLPSARSLRVEDRNGRRGPGLRGFRCPRQLPWSVEQGNE